MEDDKSKEQTPRDLRKEQRLEDFLQSQIDTSKKFSKAMESMVGSRKRKGKDGKMGEFPSVLDETRKKFTSLNRRLDTLLPRITNLTKALGKNITNSNTIMKASNKVDKESVKVKNMSVKADKKIVKAKEETAKRIIKSITHDNSKIPSAPKGYTNPTIFPWETRSLSTRLMKEDIVDNMRWKAEEKKLREQDIADRKKRNQDVLAARKKRDDEKKKQFEEEFKALLKEEEEERKRAQDEADKIRFKQPDNYHLKMLGIQKGYKMSDSDFLTDSQVGQARDEKTKAAQLAIMMAAMSSSARRKASVLTSPMTTPIATPTVFEQPEIKSTDGKKPVDLLTQMRDFLKSIMNDMNFTVSRDRRENIKNRFLGANHAMKMAKRAPVSGRDSRVSDSLFSTSFNGIPLGNPLSLLAGSGLGSTGLGAGLMALAFGGDKKQKGLMTKGMYRRARMKSLGKTVTGGGLKIGGGILKGFAGRGLLGLLTKVPIIGPFLSMGLAGAALGTGMYSSLKEGGGVYEGLKRGGSMALSLATGGLVSPEDIRSGASNIQDIIEEKLLKDYAGASFEGKTINAVASVLMNITSGMFAILGWKDIADKFKKGAENIKNFGLFGKNEDHSGKTTKELEKRVASGTASTGEVLELDKRTGDALGVKKYWGFFSTRKINDPNEVNSNSHSETFTDKVKRWFSPFIKIRKVDDYDFEGYDKKAHNDMLRRAWKNNEASPSQIELMRRRGLLTDENGNVRLTSAQQSHFDTAVDTFSGNIALAVNPTTGGTSITNHNSVTHVNGVKSSSDITGVAALGFNPNRNNFA